MAYFLKKKKNIAIRRISKLFNSLLNYYVLSKGPKVTRQRRYQIENKYLEDMGSNFSPNIKDRLKCSFRHQTLFQLTYGKHKLVNCEHNSLALWL